MGYITTTVEKRDVLPCSHDNCIEVAEHEGGIELFCTHCEKSVRIVKRCTECDRPTSTRIAQ